MPVLSFSEAMSYRLTQTDSEILVALGQVHYLTAGQLSRLHQRIPGEHLPWEFFCTSLWQPLDGGRPVSLLDEPATLAAQPVAEQPMVVLSPP